MQAIRQAERQRKAKSREENSASTFLSKTGTLEQVNKRLLVKQVAALLKAYCQAISHRPTTEEVSGAGKN